MIGAMGDIDLIIFDCDGVLIDSEMLACACLHRQLMQHGIALDLPSVMQRFLGRSIDEVARHYQAALGRPMPPLFVTELRQMIRAAFEDGLRAIPDVEKLLQRLPWTYCLASSSDPERISFSLNLAGLSPYFEERVFSAASVARAKPAPDLFLLAAREMKAEAARSLVIEDSISGVEAGKAAGMTVGGFVGGSHYVDRDGAALLRAAGADRVFQHMRDIEQALFIAPSVAG
ncbi:MAG: HAD family hydrolase [Rhodospirillaceae bacterium]|nr:HAD family hydrolase [Rhodospirillaceae bacterium]